MADEHAKTRSDQPPRAAGSAAPRRAPALFGRAVLYPNVYAWYVFLAALDVILTYLILSPLFVDTQSLTPRGSELNALADWVYRVGGLPGMAAFKFIVVALVVCICEIVGRRKAETGRRLAEWAVALSAIPVVVALVQMAVDVYSWVLS